MEKINQITTDGNLNIIIQDVNGSTINLNLNDTQAIEKLIAQNADKLNEIQAILKQSQEPDLQRFADMISKIKVVENRTSRYVKYVLLFFALPAVFAFLLYWYFVLSKPFSMTVTLKETYTIPSLPFKEGTLILQFGDKTDTLHTTGEALFKQIPANLKGEQAKLRFYAKGYTTIDTTLQLSESMDLPIMRDNSLGILFGTVKDENNQPLAGVLITVLDISVKTDDAGKFRLEIPFEKQGEEQRLTAFKQGYQTWDYTFPVIKDVETKIILKK